MLLRRIYWNIGMSHYTWIQWYICVFSRHSNRDSLRVGSGQTVQDVWQHAEQPSALSLSWRSISPIWLVSYH